MEEAQKKFVEEVNKEIELINIEKILKTNESEWEMEGITYRTKPVNYKVKMIAYEKKVEKFTELLVSAKFKLEEELKAIYKKQGVDLDSMQINIDGMVAKKNEYLFKLGKALEDKASENELLEYRGEIDKLNNEISALSIKRTIMLQYSLENQVLLYVYQWLATQTVEKKDGENWVRVWNTVEELMDSKEELVNRAIFNTTLFVGQI